MLHATGRCLGVTRDAKTDKDGTPFTLTTIHLVNGVHVDRLTIVKDFTGTLPTEGEFVVLDVFISHWRSDNGNRGYELKALARNTELESALNQPALSAPA